jgi:hypothetical protein
MENTNLNQSRTHTKPTPEVLFQVYQECNAPAAPVKLILERHGLKPWDLAALRKKAREAILATFSGNLPGRRNKSFVPLSQHQTVLRELQAVKDALAAVGHELALLKKRTNSV